jgi:HK97 family phage portal protein
MKLFDHFVKKAPENLSVKSNPFSDLLWAGGVLDNTINPTSKSGQLQAYTSVPIVASCVDVIARDTFRPYQIKDLKGNTVTPKQLGPELSTLLQYKYNSDNLSLIIKKHIIPHLLLTGNAFLMKRTSTVFGQTKGIFDSLIPINPSNVEIVLDTTQLFITGYRVSMGGIQTLVAEKDMIHFKQNTIINPCIGIGNIEKARYTVESESQSDIFLKNFLKNRATPSIAILDPKEMTQEDFSINKARLTSTFGGEENAGKLLYMTNAEGVTVETLQVSQRDQQFIEQKELNRQTIMSIFGVPGVVLGIPDGSNKAIADTMRAYYLNTTINNILSEVAQTFTSQLLEQYDSKLTWCYEMYSEADTDEVVKQYTSGVIYRNEAREALGWENIEGDSTILDPTPTSETQPVVPN